MRSLLCIGAALSACCGTALAEPAARSLDQALIETLSLSSPFGCGAAFGIAGFSSNQPGLDAFLAAERDADRLGRELVGLCGSSAVASAAALGGSLGSLQTTKTVSQFRLARTRADSRLDARGKRAALGRPLLLAQAGGGMPDSELSLTPVGALGAGVFGHVEHDRRTRVGTALEAGHRATIGEVLIGLDYLTANDLVAGAWVGYRRSDADYLAPRLLIGGNDNGIGASLDASLQADICKIAPGGGFDDKGARIGGFVAKRMGRGFADIGLQASRIDASYRRNVCAIKGQSDAIVRDADPNNPTGFASLGGVVIDEIFSGTLSGKAKVTEWGLTARAGFDVDAELFVWGPRVSLTYLRTTIGAFTETGRTSVTHPVNSNTPAVLRTVRSVGDPTGLELTFDRQRRSSLQSEVQLVAAYRHASANGTVIPRVSLAWLHEFKGERELVQVRMAQDRRLDPTRFSFTTDSSDKNKGLVAVGLSWQPGPQSALDIELSRRVADDRIDSTKLALQALWRF